MKFKSSLFCIKKKISYNVSYNLFVIYSKAKFRPVTCETEDSDSYVTK